MAKDENNRDVKEAEENDAERIKRDEGRLSVAQQNHDVLQPFGNVGGVEVGHRRRQQKQRRGKDRRNHARDVELQRQMRGFATEHAIALLSFWILDKQPPLRSLAIDDAHDHDGEQQQHADDDGGQRRHDLHSKRAQPRPERQGPAPASAGLVNFSAL